MRSKSEKNSCLLLYTYMREGSSGYALVMVVVLLGILMVLGAGAIRFASAGASAAVSERAALSAAACARAARDVMRSNIQFMHPPPTSFSMQFDGISKHLIEDGHIKGSGEIIESVEFLSHEELGTGRPRVLHPRISNDILPPGQFDSGESMRVTAVCKGDGGRVHEVEFIVRIGF